VTLRAEKEAIMNYRKLDAALATALQQPPAPHERALSVFIHTERPPAPGEAEILESNGVRAGAGGRCIFTAMLSPRAIDELSEQPWVRSLRLATQLRPLAQG
jgi:hypothetical protein